MQLVLHFEHLVCSNSTRNNYKEVTCGSDLEERQN